MIAAILSISTMIFYYEPRKVKGRKLFSFALNRSLPGPFPLKKKGEPRQK